MVTIDTSVGIGKVKSCDRLCVLSLNVGNLFHSLPRPGVHKSLAPGPPVSINLYGGTPLYTICFMPNFRRLDF